MSKKKVMNHIDITLTDPSRKADKEGKDFEHLLNNVPNTKENRDFWRDVGKNAKKAGSKVKKVVLRGRGPRGDNRCWQSVPLDKATHFSVYLVKDRPLYSDWQRGWDSRGEHEERNAHLRVTPVEGELREEIRLVRVALAKSVQENLVLLEDNDRLNTKLDQIRPSPEAKTETKPVLIHTNPDGTQIVVNINIK